MVDCFTYYQIGAEAMKRKGQISSYDHTKKTDDLLFDRIILVTNIVKMKNEAALARIKMSMNEQLKSMDNNYINISVLLGSELINH